MVIDIKANMTHSCSSFCTGHLITVIYLILGILPQLFPFWKTKFKLPLLSVIGPSLIPQFKDDNKQKFTLFIFTRSLFDS